MFEIARTKAPAKLNLHLEIGPARPDGFHELISLFQSVSLADELVFRARNGSGVVLDGDFPFPADENIITKACVLFLARTGVKAGLEVGVKKAIPMGAGLGGGSSDAAACLRALNALFGTGLGVGELAEIGAMLGSDVPFFLHGACALVRGRGEIVDPIEARSDLAFVAVDPGFPVSTREAYLAWDGENGDKRREFAFTAEKIGRAYRKDASEWGFFNSFLPLLSVRHPVLGEIREELLEDGAAHSDMSGSGSTMYGIFRTAAEAERAKERQRTFGRRVRSGFLLARNEDVILE